MDSNVPHTLRAANARALLAACQEEYLPALQSGRTAQWAKMAHSMIDLLAGAPEPPAALSQVEKDG
jgi:hypothetical protein